MDRCTRHAALVCLLLLAALLANAARVQLVQADALNEDPANRRSAIDRYAEPRGEIVVDGRPVTGSEDTHEHLRYERVYRDGPLWAPVTGFSSQVYGTSFLEAAEDPLLSGTDPMLAPLPLWHELTRSRSRGGRVVTTLDGSAQRAAYAGLAGRKGAVAALDPSTGRVLALVSSPSYDPGVLSGTGRAVERAWRRFNTSPEQPMLNRAVRQTYPPGSTFKVVTAAAALESGTVGDLDEPTDSPDPYRLPGTTTTLSNEVDGCADATLRYAFTWSCNTVFAKLGTRVGLTGMTGAARDFGFNEPGLRIPFAVAPSTFDRHMDRAQLALSSVGQFDTRATPLQMAMVAAAVAGGGTVRSPYLVERTTTDDGTPVRTAPPRNSRQAMSPRTAAQLRELMTGVVEEGTGARAAIPGATVGGKTGTAQHGVGNTGVPYAWFISWAQADDAPQPAVAVAVVVEDASAVRGEISGGGDAAPIARDVMRSVLAARAAEVD
ncbi:penicillin-binding transpeptidase domain-containing protein [Streptomyces sp. NPDC059816]|uniref:penicillin-binding transpeptidase domain-containing protein n=1 Tax=Streptomyces sp. NPDC059816 TaxID=3346960 RepID=UPI003647EA0B